MNNDAVREGPVCVSRAVAEFGMPGEPVLSLDWLSGKCLVCSSRQQLRVYDIREEGSKRSQLESLTKAVFGVTVDSHNEHRIASFFEGTVHIYDTRHFEKPISGVCYFRSVFVVYQTACCSFDIAITL
jgi:hypothetical protein